MLLQEPVWHRDRGQACTDTHPPSSGASRPAQGVPTLVSPESLVLVQGSELA